ncbi:cupin domain-containing protein [Magnetococcales bacterium HHB-1]
MKRWVVVFLFAMLFSVTSARADDYKRVEWLIKKAHKNVAGEKLVYPGGEAEVSALIVTLKPGEKTGWHNHPGIPLYAYILEGEVTITYEGKGTMVFQTGDAFMEAAATYHEGYNSGTVPVRIMAVFMGVKGRANVQKRTE